MKSSWPTPPCLGARSLAFPSQALAVLSFHVCFHPRGLPPPCHDAPDAGLTAKDIPWKRSPWPVQHTVVGKIPKKARSEPPAVPPSPVWPAGMPSSGKEHIWKLSKGCRPCQALAVLSFHVCFSFHGPPLMDQRFLLTFRCLAVFARVIAMFPSVPVAFRPCLLLSLMWQC